MVGMSMQSLTITPEEVHAPAGPPGARPDWLEAVTEYVQRAAAEGEAGDADVEAADDDAGAGCRRDRCLAIHDLTQDRGR